jgi:hypothetical protein
LLMDRDEMSNLSIIIVVLVFSSPCQRQRELLPSLGVRRLLTFYILIFLIFFSYFIV